MSDAIRYCAEGAAGLLADADWEALERDLLARRDEVLGDVGLLESGAVPAEKQPLDAGFIELPQRLLDERAVSGEDSLLGRIEEQGGRFAARVDRVVVLGIGGSYMGTRALFEALCDPCHNELSRTARGGAPRLSFEGNNVDNDAVAALLRLLTGNKDTGDVENRWGIVVISKSGGTLETAVAFRMFRQALEEFYGPESAECSELVIPVTGEQGKLRDFSRQRGYRVTFPIPDGVGGRFSIFTAVGLFPAAVLKIDVGQLLQGAAEMTARFRSEPFATNPVLQYVAVCHHLEANHGRRIRVLSTWGKRLEAVGLWYDQLLSESLGKQELGATPLTAVCTRDLHSRGQQHQQGTPDKLITNVFVESGSDAPQRVPSVADEFNQDDLNQYSNKTLPEILRAAYQGTNEAYQADGRPTADIILPRLDAHCVGQLLQMLMLATAVEGRLLGINPYGQPGVEMYKRNMIRILQD